MNSSQVSDDSAHDIVGTYGADLVSAEPLTRFEGEPAGGTWSLEAFDGDAPLNVSRIAGTYGVDLTSLQTLDAFQGESPAGAWDLLVSIRNPAFSAYAGRIDAWSLQTCAAGDVTKCRPVSICAPGFVSDGVGGCVDFDECAPFFNACAAGKTCVNQPGTFSCVACVDGDGDGVCDATDNCTQVANPDQRDGDGGRSEIQPSTSLHCLRVENKRHCRRAVGGLACCTSATTGLGHTAGVACFLILNQRWRIYG